MSAPVRPGSTKKPSRTRRRAGRTWNLDRLSLVAVFLGVPLSIYVIFVVSPFVQAIGYSFTDWGGFSDQMNPVGLANYERLWHDDTFRTALRNNILLAFVLPLLIVTLSFTLATLITVAGRSVGETKGLAGSGFYRVVSFFPYAIPAVVIGIMWSQIFDPNAGLVNAALKKLGLNDLGSTAWLGEKATAMPVTMFIIVWGLIGFYMLLFIAAIKSIPAEIYESARLEGAGRLRIALTITLPLIRENVQTAYIYLGIMALDAYVYMQALNPIGGPDNSTLVMTQYLMTMAFDKHMFGVACAIGVVLALVTAVFASLVFLINRLTGGKDRVTLA